MSKSDDLEFYEETITRVKTETDGYQISVGGACFWVKAKHGIVPQVGQVARFYGAGMFSLVRGLDIDGREVFYRTPEQQQEKNRQEAIEYKNKKKREFARSKARLDLDYESLPTQFQRRLDRFRRNNPDFRWENEAYEMSVCKDAVKIAKACGSVVKVTAFGKLGWDEQKAMVPKLFDGHSGNSFGCAVFLAKCYLTDPKLVEVQHGALCPLVGCVDYGCVPKAEVKVDV